MKRREYMKKKIPYNYDCFVHVADTVYDWM